MTTAQTYYNRIGYVEIADNNGRMIKYGGSNDGLDFKFNGTISGELCPKFSVGILGLSKETIEYLATWNPAESLERMRRIKVYAGYDGDMLASPIFDGMILTAIPTQPPNAWLEFDCILHPLSKTPPIEFDTESKEIEEIFRDIAKRNNLNARWECDSIRSDSKVTFRFDKSNYDLVNDFANRFNIIAYVEEGVLVARDKHGEKGDPKNSRIISIETGMLGVNNVTLRGAIIKKRLDATIRCFTWLNLQSKIFPKANGSYFIISKKFVGHYRGNDWFVELETLRGKI